MFTHNRKIYLSLAVSSIAILLVTILKAQTTTLNTTGQQMEGSWLLTITPDGAPAAPPPFQGLATFGRDGTLVVSSTGAPPPIPPLSTSSGTAGHGEWVRTGDRQFAVTFVTLFSSGGSLIATFKLRGRHQLNDTLDGFTGDFTNEFRDPSGKLILGGTGKTAATRIGVQPMDAQ